MRAAREEARAAREEARTAREESQRKAMYKSEHGGQQRDYAGQQRDYGRTTSAGGISSEEEKNHVIRVLEHESKVYRFEKNLLGFNNDGDYYSEHGRHPRNYDL